MENRHEDLDEMGKNVHFIEVFFKRQHVFVPRDRKQSNKKMYKKCTRDVLKVYKKYWFHTKESRT